MLLKKLAWREIELDSEDFDTSDLQLHELSTRKLQVLELLTSGFNTKMIANELSLSDETVKTHIKQIKEQLQCCSSHELIKKCYKLRKKSGKITGVMDFEVDSDRCVNVFSDKA